MPLSYLLRLEHSRLPMHVTDAQDVRRVSVLKATGLVEAEIDPAFDRGGSYRLAQAALVFQITDEGYAEIASMRSGGRGGAPVPPASAKPKALAPFDYLRSIENSPFPLRVESAEEIHCVETLKKAGLVDATVSPVFTRKQSSEPQGLAVVKRITPLGRVQLGR